jgi:hypothetical protein
MISVQASSVEGLITSWRLPPIESTQRPPM